MLRSSEPVGHVRDLRDQRTVIHGRRARDTLQYALPQRRLEHHAAEAESLSIADKAETIRQELHLTEQMPAPIVASALVKLGIGQGWAAKSFIERVDGLYHMVTDHQDTTQISTGFGSRNIAQWESFTQRLIRREKLGQRAKTVGHLFSAKNEAQPGQQPALSRGASGAPVRLYGDATHKVPRRHVSVTSEQMAVWEAFGGIDLEPALRGDAIAILNAQWLVGLADDGESISYRQRLPYEAFLTLEQVQVACCPADESVGLPLIILSAPHLHPEHADPWGDTLQRIAPLLRCFLAGGERQWGVVWAWASLHQEPDPAHGLHRTPAEQSLFERGSTALGDLFTHARVWVVRDTALPPGYPRRYDVPHDFHTESYARRGWLGLEQRLYSMVKPWTRILSADKLEHSDLGDGACSPPLSLAAAVEQCASAASRLPPISPQTFVKEASLRSFANEEDEARAVHLYSIHFVRTLGTAAVLDASHLGWGDAEAEDLADALASGHMRYAPCVALQRRCYLLAVLY